MMKFDNIIHKMEDVMMVVRLLPLIRDHSSLFPKRLDISLFRFITMLCGIDSIPWNIPHMQTCYGQSCEYFPTYNNIKNKRKVRGQVAVE
jgi:hypothetical protein